MKVGFKKASEERSLALRRELALSSTAPLPARVLAQYLGVSVISPEQIRGLRADDVKQLLEVDNWAWSAVTIQFDLNTLIIYNSSHPAGRQESDIMHELAHVLCGHIPAQIGNLLGLDFPLREFPDEQEEEAAWLAGCIQIPRGALLRAVSQKMSNSEIAQHYGASEQLVQFRRNVTGVDRQLLARHRRAERHQASSI